MNVIRNVIAAIISLNVSFVSEIPCLAQYRGVFVGPEASRAGFLVTARCLMLENQFREAMKSLETGVPRNDTEAALRCVLLGQCFEERNDNVRAWDCFSKAKKLNTLGCIPVLREGVLRMRSGDVLTAIRAFEECINRGSVFPEACFHLILLQDLPDEDEIVSKLIAFDGPDGYWTKKLVSARHKEKMKFQKK